MAMQALLADRTFKPRLLEEVEETVVNIEGFPHDRPSGLNEQVAKAVNLHLATALYDQVCEQTEADLQKKLNADRKKALDGFKNELRSAGLIG